MSDQLSLLPEPQAPYQKSSPASRDGALAIEPKLVGLQRAALDAYRRAGRAGLTDEELASAIGVVRTTAIPRRHELADRGLVTDQPIGRRAGRSGVRCGVYAITEHGE